MSGKRFPLILAAVVISLAVIPYLVAFQASDADWQFGGFLINPVDGYSYLAKMQLGASGEWRFTLPYTAEPGEGAFLFLFYISLGHLSRLLGLNLLTVFHAARAAGGIFLIWSLDRFSRQFFPTVRDRNLALLLAAAGSGLGWLAIFGGMFTSDFWVAEAFPFLSLYTNPHFPFGLALMVLGLLPGERNPGLRGIALGTALGIIQPFGVVIIILVKMAGLISWLAAGKHRLRDLALAPRSRSLIAFGLSGGGVLLYQYGAILTDPVLAAWHAQNLTPTPGVADLLLSFSPCLITALIGFQKAWASGRGRTLVFWAGSSLLLLLLPWSLQRRFMTGLYVPLAFLSVWGLETLAESFKASRRFWLSVILVLSLPTNFIVIASGLQAARAQDPQIYIPQEVSAAMAWLSENSREGELVLANEQISLLIPALSGRRVIYGHPFETTQADGELDFLEDFLTEPHPPGYYRSVLSLRGIDIVIVRDQDVPSLKNWLRENWILVWQEDDLQIFQGKKE